MEIINKSGQETPASKQWGHHIYLGVALITIGIIWILRNFGIIGERFFDIFFSWQILLVVIGGYLLCMKRWVSGAIITLTGIIFVATDLLGIYVSFSKVVLPLSCIIAGIAVLVTRKYR